MYIAFDQYNSLSNLKTKQNFVKVSPSRYVGIETKENKIRAVPKKYHFRATFIAFGALQRNIVGLLLRCQMIVAI